MSRVCYLGLVMALALGLFIFSGCTTTLKGPDTQIGMDPRTVRVAVVKTPHDTGLLDALILDFEGQSEYRITVKSGTTVYEQARAGEADLVISHFGRHELEGFVKDGYGMWPRMVFANQATLVGPEDDPANIRGLRDPVEAFRRISATESPYILSNSPVSTHLTGYLWEASGAPPKGSWFIKTDKTKIQALQLAEAKQGYIIYGAFPFLRDKGHHKLKMEALVVDAPVFHRVMASIVIDAQKIPNVNVAGAKEFEAYLLSPRAQALVAAFRMPDSAYQLWWPAARHNAL